MTVIKNSKDLKNSTKLIVFGVILVVAGFIVLSLVNRMATNWAGYTAPALLVSGWIIIAIGLWKSEK